MQFVLLDYINSMKGIVVSKYYITWYAYVLSLVFLPKVGNPNWNEIIDVT